MRTLAASVLLVSSFTAAGAQEMPASLDRYLRETVKLTAAEMGEARAGRPVAKA